MLGACLDTLPMDSTTLTMSSNTAWSDLDLSTADSDMLDVFPSRPDMVLQTLGMNTIDFDTTFEPPHVDPVTPGFVPMMVGVTSALPEHIFPMNPFSQMVPHIFLRGHLDSARGPAHRQLGARKRNRLR